jgi:hypothetical protein
MNSNNENKTVTPFGEYGILIRDVRQSNVCKPDLSKIKESEYLFQRGCSFDIYKWNGDAYIPSLHYDGKDYIKGSGKVSKDLMPMHIWLESLDDLQKWLGPYYEAAIACMLAPDKKKTKPDVSDIEDALSDLWKKPYDDYYKDTIINDKTWKDNTYWDTTTISNTFNDISTSLDNVKKQVKKWKAIK